MTPDRRAQVLARLRALMAMTVAHGCTEDEELAAARQVARTIAELDADAAAIAAAPVAGGWAGRERADPAYRATLDRAMLRDLLKAAVRELALAHLATLLPRRVKGTTPSAPRPRVRADTRALLLDAMAAALGAVSGPRPAQDEIAAALDDLIEDGSLPATLALPIED